MMRQKTMVVGTSGKGYLPLGEQEEEKGNGEAPGARHLQDPFPVTYFLQLGPTSQSSQNLQKQQPPSGNPVINIQACDRHFIFKPIPVGSAYSHFPLLYFQFSFQIGNSTGEQKLLVITKHRDSNVPLECFSSSSRLWFYSGSCMCGFTNSLNFPLTPVDQRSR
jgi:hypothetical protein